MDVQISTILDLYDDKIKQLTRENVMLQAENLKLKELLERKDEPDGETDTV